MSTFVMYDRLARLIVKKKLGEATAEEEYELNAWRNISEENDQLYNELINESILDKLNELSQFNPEKGYLKFQLLVTRYGKSIRTSKRKLFRDVAIAATTTLIITSLVFFYLYNKKKAAETIVKKDIPEVPVNITSNKHDITISLGNGERIKLDSTGRRVINNEQGNFSIVQQGASVKYLPRKNKADTVTLFNTLSTPLGAQYMVILPDGSRAWLNSGSSIRFSVQDASKVRRVEITGEVYFEVSAVLSRPFIVKAGILELTAWGTKFNINAYGIAGKIQTALLEGKVNLSVNGRITPMNEREVAEIDTVTNVITKLTAPNIEDEIAWKNGEFGFTNAGILDIMKQLTPWYGIEANYIDTPKIHVTAFVDRRISADSMFRTLEENHNIHFKIVGKKVTLSSNIIP